MTKWNVRSRLLRSLHRKSGISQPMIQCFRFVVPWHLVEWTSFPIKTLTTPLTAFYAFLLRNYSSGRKYHEKHLVIAFLYSQTYYTSNRPSSFPLQVTLSLNDGVINQRLFRERRESRFSQSFAWFHVCEDGGLVTSPSTLVWCMGFQRSPFVRKCSANIRTLSAILRSQSVHNPSSQSLQPSVTMTHHRVLSWEGAMKSLIA